MRVPTLILQGQADRVAWPHDTRVLGGRLRGPVQLHELAAGHLLLDPTTPAWEHVRDLILSFIQG
jgi:pimeloyl-ACP methyl ester carboxylesterase